MDGRPTWTDCDQAGDYVVPSVLSPMDLVFRPDNMDEIVPHLRSIQNIFMACWLSGERSLPIGLLVSYFCSKTNIIFFTDVKNALYNMGVFS